VVEDDEFNGLLLAASQTPAKYRGTYWTEMVQALLWVLWESGMRINEVLGLNVGDVVFEDEQCAWIRMRHQAHEQGQGNQKTGPRPVYVGECPAAIRAWLALHPAGTDPHAPLFLACSDRSGRRRLSASTVATHILPGLAARSGLASKREAASIKGLSPHDFRHSSGTRGARLLAETGGDRSILEKKHGWKPGSRQASRYIHLSVADQRAYVRRNLGLDVTGRATRTDVADPDSKLLRALKRLMDEETPKGITKPVREDQLP